MTQTAKPGSAEELGAAIQDAIAAKRTLELVGRRTRRHYGRPVVADEMLDLSGLAGIVTYEPEELVLTVGTGTPLAQIECLLAEHRQQLAFEPPDFGPVWGHSANGGTIGGALMMGLGGPRRPFVGAPRDHLLGIKGVNGFGESYAAGGRVVKNVTGYDLPKLLAGSLGTLSALTQVTVKVLPSPREVRTLRFVGLQDDAAIALMTRALNSSAAVSGAAHLPATISSAFPAMQISRPDGAVTLLRLEGVGPSVTARMQTLATMFDNAAAMPTLEHDASIRCWKAIGDIQPFTRDLYRPLWRLCVPPSHASSIAATLARQLDMRHFYDWGGGVLWLELGSDEADANHALIRSTLTKSGGADGHATLMRASADIRARIAPMQPLAESLAQLTRRVKARFDPQGLFNPGRMYQDW